MLPRVSSSLRYAHIGDVGKLQADQVALKRYAGQAGALGAPQKYKQHEVVFLSAIDELYQAARLAYVLAADPISATQADFDRYDGLVEEAASDLQRSNEILGKGTGLSRGSRESAHGSSWCARIGKTLRP